MAGRLCTLLPEPAPPLSSLCRAHAVSPLSPPLRCAHAISSPSFTARQVREYAGYLQQSALSSGELLDYWTQSRMPAVTRAALRLAARFGANATALQAHLALQALARPHVRLLWDRVREFGRFELELLRYKIAFAKGLTLGERLRAPQGLRQRFADLVAQLQQQRPGAIDDLYELGNEVARQIDDFNAFAREASALATSIHRFQASLATFDSMMAAVRELRTALKPSELRARAAASAASTTVYATALTDLDERLPLLEQKFRTGTTIREGLIMATGRFRELAREQVMPYLEAIRFRVGLLDTVQDAAAELDVTLERVQQVQLLVTWSGTVARVATLPAVVQAYTAELEALVSALEAFGERLRGFSSETEAMAQTLVEEYSGLGKGYVRKTGSPCDSHTCVEVLPYPRAQRACGPRGGGIGRSPDRQAPIGS